MVSEVQTRITGYFKSVGTEKNIHEEIADGQLPSTSKSPESGAGDVYQEAARSLENDCPFHFNEGLNHCSCTVLSSLSECCGCYQIPDNQTCIILAERACPFSVHFGHICDQCFDSGLRESPIPDVESPPPCSPDLVQTQEILVFPCLDSEEENLENIDALLDA